MFQLQRGLRSVDSEFYFRMPRQFLASLLLLLVCFTTLNALANPPNERHTDLHLKFEDESKEPSWTSQNDDVMGGVSKGRAIVQDGILIFSGSLSLDNNGGFAQVRIQNLGLDLSKKSGIALRVKGDGRTYQLRLATNARFRGSRISYSVQFPTTAGEWSEVQVQFADLKPSHHGNPLDGPTADLSQIEEMSFLIGDKREGPFELQVDWMKAKS